MYLINSIPISVKLIVSFLIVAAIGAYSGYDSINKAREMTDANRVMFEKCTVAISSLGEAGKDFQRIRVNLRDLALLTDAEEVNVRRERLGQCTASVLKNLADVEKTLISDKDKEHFRNTMEAWAAYRPHMEELISLEKDGKTKEFKSSLFGSAFVLAKKFEADLTLLTRDKVATAERLAKENQTRAEQSIATTTRMVLGGTVMAMLVGIVLSAMISIPLRRVARVAGEVAAFVELVAKLRAECPWDGEQTHRTLTRHLLEETYEVLEALGAVGDGGAAVPSDAYDHLEEELGDLFFQIVFHTTLATEAGAFGLADVARGIHHKLVHRHPHVFGSVEVDGTDQVVANWEAIKKQEKGRASIFDGMPADLPALLYALKVAKKASSLGVEVAIDLDATDGTLPLGERLLALVVAARRADPDVDPETELRAAAAALRDRAKAIE